MIKNIPSLKKRDKEESQNNENHPTDNSTIRNMGVAGGASVIARKHADKAAETFKKPTKYNRSLIDDGTAKRNIKIDAFKSNVEVKDPYTGEILKLTKAEAKMQYGEEWTKHLAEADHVISLKQRYEDTKNKPWLSNDDIKKSSNSPDNLVVNSRKFNNAKRDRSNTEFVNDDAYLEKKDVHLTADGKVKAIQDEKISQNKLKVQDFKDGTRNVVKTGHKAGMDAAKSGALIGGGISAIQNVVAVVKGEKDAGEAVIDTAKDTAGAAVLSYSTGALGSTISHTLSYSSNTMLKSLSKTNLPSQIAVAALETGKTMKKFICGEIDGTECMIELGEKGTGMIASSYGAIAGQVLIPIPVVGGMIGSMVGYAFASSYYNGLVGLMQNRKLAHEERIRIEAECKETLEAIRSYRREVEKIAEAYFADHKRVFDTAFGTISQALQTGDADGIIAGANMITEKLGGEVQYKNMKEFDEFMNDEDVDFVL